uniref:Small ribosomal subunit protein uS14 n=1 Tax=Poecilia reticulata TaxID=8081 RepID=A0A3P9PKD5_POERE
MGHGQLFGTPRKLGLGSRCCPMCSNSHGLIRKYRLNMYRQCFTRYVKSIGCVKLERC